MKHVIDIRGKETFRKKEPAYLTGYFKDFVYIIKDGETVEGFNYEELEDVIGVYNNYIGVVDDFDLELMSIIERVDLLRGNRFFVDNKAYFFYNKDYKLPYYFDRIEFEADGFTLSIGDYKWKYVCDMTKFKRLYLKWRLNESSC